MPRALQSSAQVDFSGGLGNALQPWDLDERHCLASDNFVHVETGGLATRPGSTSGLFAQSPSPTKSIVSLYGAVYNQQDSQAAILYSPSTSNIVYSISSGGWTVMGTFETNYQIPQMVLFTNRLFFAAGYERLKMWTLTGGFQVVPAVNPPLSYVGQSLPKGACHLKAYKQRLYVFNTAKTDDPNALDGPSFLRCCEINNPTSWPLIFSTVIGAQGDGQQGMGLMPFVVGDAALSPLSNLVLFREFSTFQLSGDLGSSFSVDTVKTNMGCFAPRSLIFLRGVGIIRLSHLGFSLFNGSSDELVSEQIRPYIFGDSTQGIDPLDWFNIQSSCAVELANPQGYACFCPVQNAGAGNTRCFVYYPAQQAWTVLQFPFAVSSVASTGFTNNPQNILTGDTSGGFVRRIFGPETDDDGAPVRWKFKPRPWSWSGHAGDDTFYRRVNVSVAQSIPGTSFLLTTILEPTKQASVITTTPMPAQLSSIVGGWGNFPWGNEPWGGFLTTPSQGIPPTPKSGEWGASPWGAEPWGGTGGVITSPSGWGSSPWGAGPWGDGVPTAPASLQGIAQETTASVDLDQWGNGLWCQLQGQGPARIRKFEVQMVPYPPTRTV